MTTELEPQPKLFGNDPRYERYRWQIFCITWLAYAGFYLTRKSFSVAKIELAKPEVLGMSNVELAWIDGAYLTAYAAGQFVWGISGDRFGTRKVVLIGMLCSVVTAVAMGASRVEKISSPEPSVIEAITAPGPNTVSHARGFRDSNADGGG